MFHQWFFKTSTGKVGTFQWVFGAEDNSRKSMQEVHRMLKYADMSWGEVVATSSTPFN